MSRAVTARARHAKHRAQAPAPPNLLPTGHAAATRALILDTAERLFATHGVDGVAVRDLAREMHLTAPSLYNHFPGKEALYAAVLERGLRPIMEMLVEAWQPGALRPERMRTTVDRLIAHLAQHPHLARLLQRALLEENGSASALLARWLQPLYHRGVAVIEETADEAGWEPAELPHLTLGLFGMAFAYFTNTALLRSLPSKTGDPMSARALAVQRQFLEKAIYRLLGPTGRRTAAKTKSPKPRRGSTGHGHP